MKKISALPLKVPVIRHFIARPRLGLAILIGIGLWFFLPQEWKTATSLLVAWNTSVGAYLVLAIIMMGSATRECMQQRAAALDDGKIFILLFTIITAVASLAGIVAELATAKASLGGVQLSHITLAGMTVLLSWTFMHVMFALHYAHEYYDDDDGTRQGLDFPGDCPDPDYWDFVYFSFIIGAAAQTADVSISSRMIRRIATLHCTVSFLFNTTILALTINIGASLL